MLCHITGRRACPLGLRHAFGVDTLQAGVSLNLAQRWLGHAQISTMAIHADASWPGNLLSPRLLAHERAIVFRESRLDISEPGKDM